MNIRPLGRRVLIESVYKRKVSDSGIIFADDMLQNEWPDMGRVLAANHKLDFRVGDIVVKVKNSGRGIGEHFGVNSTDLMLLEEKHIIAVAPPDTELELGERWDSGKS